MKAILEEKLSSIKSGNEIISISIFSKGKTIGKITPVVEGQEKKREIVTILSNWRRDNQSFFPTQFRVTKKGTRKWMVENLQKKKDRILFFVVDLDGKRIGHVGLANISFQKKSCEIDNVIRGEKGSPGIMTSAVKGLIKWVGKEFSIKNFGLWVSENNMMAINLYKRCKFRINPKYMGKNLAEKELLANQFVRMEYFKK